MELTIGSYRVQLEQAHDISIPVRFDGKSVSVFGAPAAHKAAYETDGFTGDVKAGGSCNCDMVTFSPHLHGTHTECVGHIVSEDISVHDVLHDAFIPAQLITIRPALASDTNETYVPNLRADDRLITRVALEHSLGNEARSADRASLEQRPMARAGASTGGKKQRAISPRPVLRSFSVGGSGVPCEEQSDAVGAEERAISPRPVLRSFSVGGSGVPCEEQSDAAGAEERAISPRPVLRSFSVGGSGVPSACARALRRDKCEERSDAVGAENTALIIRTGHMQAGGLPPFFSMEAMEYLNELGVTHLLVDMSSIDRLDDEGHLTNHHIFWGLPQGVNTLDGKIPSHKTITEFIHVPDSLADGHYVLNLQVAAFEADAAPSRPLLYEIAP